MWHMSAQFSRGHIQQRLGLSKLYKASQNFSLNNRCKTKHKVFDAKYTSGNLEITARNFL
jgi:hypothetical protein